MGGGVQVREVVWVGVCGLCCSSRYLLTCRQTLEFTFFFIEKKIK